MKTTKQTFDHFGEVITYEKERNMTENESKAVPCISLLGIVAELEKAMGCNCDLDNWEPERDTGHAWVCRIHKTAKSKWDDFQRGRYMPNAGGDAHGNR